MNPRPLRGAFPSLTTCEPSAALCVIRLRVMDLLRLSELLVRVGELLRLRVLLVRAGLDLRPGRSERSPTRLPIIRKTLEV